MAASVPRIRMHAGILPILALILAVVLGLVPAQPAAAERRADPTLGSITGLVTGAAGQPLVGHTVLLLKASGASGFDIITSVSTGADGRYRFDAVSPSRYTVQIGGGTGHVGEYWNDVTDLALATTFPVAAAEAVAGVDAQLSIGASISGMVEDPAGAAVAGATVALFGQLPGWGWGYWRQTTSDAAGSYSFSTLPPGLYAVRVQPPVGSGLIRTWWPDSPYEAGATRFSVDRDEVVEGIDVPLAEGATVRGTVTADSGAPLAGVGVSLAVIPTPTRDALTFFARTGPDGTYSIPLLPAGDYSPVGFSPAPETNLLAAQGAPVSIGAGDDVTRDGILPTGGSISGVVTGRDGLPLSGVTVIASGEAVDSERTTTNELGEYRLQRLVAGSYTLEFSRQELHYRSTRAHFSEWWQDSPTRAGRTYFALGAGQQLAGMDASLTPAATIAGTVRGPGGEPAPGQVRLYAVEGGALRLIQSGIGGSDGSYFFGGLHAGRYTVQFISDNHVSEWWGDQREQENALVFDIAEGDNLTAMDAELSAGSSISGRLMRYDGYPARLEEVTVYRVEPSGRTRVGGASADDNGDYTVAGLLPGSYLVQFSAGNALADEWWNNSADVEHATTIMVGPDEAITGIDAQLDAAAVDLPLPRITGDLTVGALLTEGTSPGSNVTLTYQWLADGVEIVGATGKTVRLAPGHVGTVITVRVTGNAPRYAPTTRISQPSAPVAPTTMLPGTASIQGSPAVGYVLAATPSGWQSGTTFTYQWLADGAEIVGATSATLVLASEQASTQIRVRITGSRPGYLPIAATSAATSPVYLTARPEIVGSPVVGSTLSAVSGTWAPGSELGYQWLLSGVPVGGAIGTEFALTAPMAGQPVSVRVTGSGSGHLPAERTSAPTMLVATAGTPQITGSAATNEVVTANPGVWTPGTSFSYQWRSNGSVIAGATGSTLMLTEGHAGTRITVAVTGSKVGYPDVTRTSMPTAPVYGAPIPSIAGNPVVGGTLTLLPGSWTSGSALSYQWYRDGIPIAGAATTTLLLTSSTEGARITVGVTGRKSGSPTTTRSSAPTLRVIAAGSPVVTGTASVGSSLTVASGPWTSGTILQYQWFADGIAIDGATASTLTVTDSLVGRRIAASVTGSQTGFATTAKLSASTAKVARAGNPTITGAPAPGSVLTARPGTWGPGTTFTYQWYRDGVPITGATAPTYVVVKSDVLAKVSVRVTGAAPGYATVPRTSATMTVVAARAFGTAPRRAGT